MTALEILDTEHREKAETTENDLRQLTFVSWEWPSVLDVFQLMSPVGDWGGR